MIHFIFKSETIYRVSERNFNKFYRNCLDAWVVFHGTGNFNYSWGFVAALMSLFPFFFSMNRIVKKLMRKTSHCIIDAK